jgi:hypothetical protein
MHILFCLHSSFYILVKTSRTVQKMHLFFFFPSCAFVLSKPLFTYNKMASIQESIRGKVLADYMVN